MAGYDYLPPDQGFLEAGRADAARPDLAQAVVIPFGLEASVSYGGGTKAGPAAILAASQQLELFDEEFWLQPCDHFGVATLAAEEIAKSVPGALDQLEGIVEQVLAAGRFPLVLGGEHSLTAGAIRPFVRRYPGLVVLQIDAHADLRDGYLGEHYSHAAAMRRVLDHEGVELVSVGIRAISAGEIPFLEQNPARIRMHFTKDKATWDIERIVAPLHGRPVYVTFDIDGLDPSLMPATGTPEPGGLLWEEALELLRAAGKAGRVVGADIVELAPIAGFHAANFLTAKLAYKLLSYALLKRVDSQ